MFKGLGLFFILGALIGALDASANAPVVDPSKTLLLRDLEVVENVRAQPGGVWSFSWLTSQATRDNPDWKNAFLNEWAKTQASNGQPLTPRRSHDLLKYWPDNREGKDPFRLLAIVFRLDLRTPEKPAGEGRFVFGLQTDVMESGVDLTLILEYPLPVGTKPGERSLRDWASDIYELESLAGEEKLAHLEKLTRAFSEAPTQLSLRTNDFFLSLEWEMRNFQLKDRQFQLALLPQTPSDSFLQGDSKELIEWVERNSETVLKGTHELPQSWLGGATRVSDDGFKWLTKSGLPENLRAAFSMRTCNGCHAAETGTRFQHVFNRKAGQIARISDFLANDLLVRERDLERILDLEKPVNKNQPKDRRGRVH